MPNIEVFYLFVLVAAARAGLAAWIEGWYFYNCSSCPTGFIIKLSEELSPRNIGNTFSKVVIANHTIYIEVFYTDDLVFFHQCRYKTAAAERFIDFDFLFFCRL